MWNEYVPRSWLDGLNHDQAFLLETQYKLTGDKTSCIPEVHEVNISMSG